MKLDTKKNFLCYVVIVQAENAADEATIAAQPPEAVQAFETKLSETVEAGFPVPVTSFVFQPKAPDTQEHICSEALVAQTYRERGVMGLIEELGNLLEGMQDVKKKQRDPLADLFGSGPSSNPFADLFNSDRLDLFERRTPRTDFPW